MHDGQRQTDVMDGDGAAVAELAARLQAVRREHRRCEHELARLLVAFDQARGCERYGQPSTVAWARETLDLEGRQTRELLRIGRRLPDLPEVAAAFAAGEVGWTKVRELVRVATHETESEWLERARQRTARELEREVAASRPGDPPPDDEDLDDLPARVVLRFDMAATDAQDLRRALYVLGAQRGDQAADEGALLAMLARHLLRQSHGAEAPMPEEQYRVVLTECPGCRKTTHVGHDGVHAVAPEVRDEAQCDCEVVDLRQDAAEPGRLAHAIPPTIRRQVMHRDGYRCAVPGCGGWVWTQVHHLQPRAEGGRHGLENLVVLCSGHHRLVHDRRLRVWRGEDGALQVERAAPEPPPAIAVRDPGLSERVLEVLAWASLETTEVARCLCVREDEALAWLRWHERHGDVVRVPGGEWIRLPAAA